MDIGWLLAIRRVLRLLWTRERGCYCPAGRVTKAKYFRYSSTKFGMNRLHNYLILGEWLDIAEWLATPNQQLAGPECLGLVC